MRRVLIGVALLSLAFAPAPLPRREARQPDEFQRFQGVWVQTDPMGMAVKDTNRWVFLGGGKMEIRSGQNKYYWNYTIDPRATPRTLNMDYSPNGTDKSVLLAVYELDGDTLRIGYDSGNWNKRPESEKTAGHRMTFRRER